MEDTVKIELEIAQPYMDIACALSNALGTRVEDLLSVRLQNDLQDAFRLTLAEWTKVVRYDGSSG